jgi:hypothetical protein
MLASISRHIAWAVLALASGAPMVWSGALRSSASGREAAAAMSVVFMGVNCSFGGRISGKKRFDEGRGLAGGRVGAEAWGWWNGRRQQRL